MIQLSPKQQSQQIEAMKIQVTINGASYPCYPTMGAMLRFKQETGRELTTIQPDSVSDLCTYLWCCTASASKREGKKFDMELMDFADALDPDDLMRWSTEVNAQTSDETDAPQEQKKSSSA